MDKHEAWERKLEQAVARLPKHKPQVFEISDRIAMTLAEGPHGLAVQVRLLARLLEVERLSEKDEVRTLVQSILDGVTRLGNGG